MINLSIAIMLTGGAGFIGSHTASALAEQGCEVVAVDNLNDFYSPQVKRKNIGEIKSNRLFFYEEDIRALHPAHEIFVRHKIGSIVHLAAMAGVRPSILSPALYQDVNVLGTQVLLDTAQKLGIPDFIFASSSSVYGVNPNVPWKESDYVLEPVSPYAATKLSGEFMGSVYNKLYGINFTALRFFTVYGPRQRPDLAISKFIKKISSGEPIDIYGDGSTFRDYTYVNDIVSGVVSAVERELRGYNVINIGNNKPTGLLELVETIEEVVGKRADLNFLPEQTGDVPRTFADIKKAEQMLDYRPTTSLQEGIRRQFEYMRR